MDTTNLEAGNDVMIPNLAKPISKKLLFAMLIVTIGAEVLLYLSRYSYMASSLYDGMMVGSFFIGWKLFKRLSSPQDSPKRPRQVIMQFSGAFLIFFLGSTVINIYSSNTFLEFNDDYDQYVQDYTESQAYEPDIEEAPIDHVWSFFDKVDTIGSDIYADTLAGLEEVWRLAYMILILIVFRKLFPKRWESGRRDVFLMLALFLTSILFGIDHTLDTEQPWSIRIGAIVTFANMGLLFGIILLWTRNLWVTVLVHSLYDITATLSWYYIDYAVEYFALGCFILYLILFTLEKLQQKRVRKEMGAVDLAQGS
ncbi:membrane protease YdiL (CAAX protease family) [Bacillus sp. SORGH_AS 510]|uniref:CPBP family intramembrane glutamic endopeptidase n=1 Tax=Bacillus sp. SORGH_AS_0510 TaxID=3041771 RepID=UPI0027824363|nr:CPBP family intramembrane glutamic endopeptidase [Bacillus sp. SORGH_AS_0510]MDQ1144308.1 membrane protease YdiL (CAAX protease family) [Bacillus sp. SORGH_AS_0510]